MSYQNSATSSKTYAAVLAPIWIVTELGRRSSTAKDYAARVVHNLAKTIETRSAGDSATFPSIKAPRTTPTGFPYEAVSFPSFRHYELIEEWEDSLLLNLP